MLDSAAAYSRYKFLGYEFLTWLWFVIETQPTFAAKFIDGYVELRVGNKIVFENMRNQTRETITIKGDDPPAEAGKLSLKNGAYIAALNLILKTESNTWQFTINGDLMNFGGLKSAGSAALADSGDEFEAAVLDKIYAIGAVMEFIDHLFSDYLALRSRSEWELSVIPSMRAWFGGV